MALFSTAYTLCTVLSRVLYKVTRILSRQNFFQISEPPRPRAISDFRHSVLPVLCSFKVPALSSLLPLSLSCFHPSTQQQSTLFTASPRSPPVSLSRNFPTSNEPAKKTRFSLTS